MTRDEILTEARSWIGTKWQHQASLKGVACDCVGLIRGVYTALTGEAVDIAADYSRWPDLRQPDEQLRAELLKYCTEVPIDEAKPGDILLFVFPQPARHVGILAGDTFIHAWTDVNKVVEIRYDAVWRRVTKGVFRFPGVVD